jgi:heat shock protein HtpX
MRTLKVFVLMAGLTALMAALGQWAGGTGGAMMALVLAGVMNFAMYYWSDRMVLRMYGAQVVSERQAPQLYRMVDRLRQRAGLPMPTVAVAPHAQPNAFATGRNAERAVVCVTEGLLKVVDERELEGVIAHELAHIKNRDMLLSTIAATMAGAISHLAWTMMWFGGRDDEGHSNPIGTMAMIIVAPLAAGMIQMAISRAREFEADRVGAEISGQPLALARALKKLDLYARRIPMHVEPAAAPLAQVNPLAATGGGFMMKLFSTHPPIEERVEKLERMARGR